MQGFTQQSRMHPGASQAMTAGIGGLHRPMPKPPTVGPTIMQPHQPAAMPHGGGMSQLAQALLAARQQQHVPPSAGAQILATLAQLRGGMR